MLRQKTCASRWRSASRRRGGEVAAAAASAVASSAIGGAARVEMGSEPGTASSDTAERCGGDVLVRPATGESAVEMPSSASGEQSAAAETAAALPDIGGEGVGGLRRSRSHGRGFLARFDRRREDSGGLE